MVNENNNVDFGKPVFLGQVENKHPDFGGEGALYVFYCHPDADMRNKEFLFGSVKPDEAILAFTENKSFDGEALRMFLFNRKDREVIEDFITSDNPEKKQFLQNVLQEMEDKCYDGLVVGDIRPAFNKLKDTYDHERFNKNKLAQLRKNMAKSVDNALGTNLEEKKLPLFLKRIEDKLGKTK